MKKLIALSLVITASFLLSCQKETPGDEAINNQNLSLTSKAKVEKARPFLT